MKDAIALTFAALTLAGCSTTSDKTATTPSSNAPRVTAPTASFDAPHVTAVGTSPISPGRQPAFCKDQAAYMCRRGAAKRYHARARGRSGRRRNNRRYCR